MKNETINEVEDIEEELIKSLLAPTKPEQLLDSASFFSTNHSFFQSEYQDRKDFKINKDIRCLIEALEEQVENAWNNIDIVLLCIYYYYGFGVEKNLDKVNKFHQRFESLKYFDYRFDGMPSNLISYKIDLELLYELMCQEMNNYTNDFFKFFIVSKKIEFDVICDKKLDNDYDKFQYIYNSKEYGKYNLDYLWNCIAYKYIGPVSLYKNDFDNLINNTAKYNLDSNQVKIIEEIKNRCALGMRTKDIGGTNNLRWYSTIKNDGINKESKYLFQPPFHDRYDENCLKYVIYGRNNKSKYTYNEVIGWLTIDISNFNKSKSKKSSNLYTCKIKAKLTKDGYSKKNVIKYLIECLKKKSIKFTDKSIRYIGGTLHEMKIAEETKYNHDANEYLFTID